MEKQQQQQPPQRKPGKGRGGGGGPGGPGGPGGGGNNAQGERDRDRRDRSPQRPPHTRVPASGKLLELFKGGDETKQELMQLAHEFAAHMGNVKHHQLRNLLDAVIWAKQSHREGKESALQAQTRGRLASLRPRVAYMAARERGLLGLRDELDLVLKDAEAFTKGADLDQLYEFVAAVVAYHKFEEVTREHQRSK
jgi:CRISPR type III-A-associated protein Csm2